jgi:hypothetical protein
MARLVLTRNELEGLALPMLAAAAFQYTHFKQGADVHIFWSHYFAPYFALAVGALTATAQALVVKAAPHLRGALGRLVRAWPAAVGAGLVALPVLFVFQDGARTIRLGRETGGRYLSSDIQSDVDKVIALRWLLPRMAPDDRIGVHPGIYPVHWGLAWETRPHVMVPRMPIGTRASLERFYIIDTRFATGADLKQAVGIYRVHAIGQYWVIDRREQPAPLEGYRFDEHEPSLLQSFLQGQTEPVRTVVADPWVTWQWRTLLGQQPAVAPAGTSQTLEQLAIAHNVAVAAGDGPGAARARSAVEASLTRHMAVKFSGGTELRGAYQHRGAERSLTFLFIAGDLGGAHAKFGVTAHVAKPPIFSTLPADNLDVALAYPPVVPTELWRPGHMYLVKVPYRKRPGTEHLTGSFVRLDDHPAPVVVGQKQPIPLIDL